MMTKHKQSVELNPFAADERQIQAVVRVLRLAFFVMMATVALLTILSQTRTESGETKTGAATIWWVTASSTLFLFCAFLLTDIFTPRKKIATLTAIFVGLVAGLIGTYALGQIINLLAKLWQFEENVEAITVATLLFGISLSYLCISTVLQTKDDFRLVIPYVEFARQIRGPRPLLLDSSVLIDSRILDLAGTGIIQYPMVVPQFVITELQTLADSRDKLKRARGRRGLDVITRLQRSPTVDISIDPTEASAKGVDQQLVELASQMNATIVTNDIALNRIAGIQDVRVINMNEVSNALKPSLIPGEQLAIKLIKPGEQRGQAVGYLDDGTMVIAENGANHIDQLVTLTVTSSLQTAAGRLIFGRMDIDDGRDATRHPRTDAMRKQEVEDISDDDDESDEEPVDQSVTQTDTTPNGSPFGAKEIAAPEKKEPQRPRTNITGRNPRR
ncbi:MAG: PIN/TRAM domain-containing protein [Phycisphaeraceae bacterium]|nr:hypothetical protein [Phycisphaerales bacterium]MCB9860142.1 PIN/TRAM domain-containing protein [Phycisphaeraceae bacterium]